MVTQLHVIPEVIEQHSEEAAFLWLARSRVTMAPNFSLRELAEVDSRLEAHLDGLRIAGKTGWEVCRRQLASKEAGEVFTAAVLAVESADELGLAEVLAVSADDLELARSVISALGWAAWEHAQPHVAKLAQSKDPVWRRIAVGGWAVQRVNPGHDLVRCIDDVDPIVVARALRAAGELGQRELLPIIRAASDHSDEMCRFWSAWSAALLGDKTMLPVLRTIAEIDSPLAERAALLYARAMPQTEVLSWHSILVRDRKCLSIPAKVAGAIGDPTLVPWLLEQMATPAIAGAAGEAFTTITGVDLTREKLAGQPPLGFESGPTDDPGDGDVAMDADHDLPFPIPSLVTDWWAKHGGVFRPGMRYLLGKPIDDGSLKEALRTGRQRQRAAAALELVLRQPGSPLFEVRARGDRQRKTLGM